MGGAAQCFGWDMYKMKAYGLIAQKGDTFRIGVRMDAEQDWWCIFDSFKLTYREPTAEIVKPILEEAIEGLAADQPMAKSVYEKVAVVKAAAEQAIASGDGNAMFDALSDIFDVKEEVANSVVLFAGLKTQAEDLLYEAGMSNNAVAAAAAENLAQEVLTKSEAHEIETEEVDEYKAMMTQAMKNLYKETPSNMDLASDESPVEATGLIIANSYEINGSNSALGWEGTTGSYGPEDQWFALAFEYFNNTFDHYQDIDDIPNGIYEVGVNAFGRYGSIDNDYTMTQEAPGTNESFLYATSGDQTYSVALKTVFSEALTEDPGYDGEVTSEKGGVTYYIPNNVSAGVAFFESGCYQNKLIAKVTDGKLRIGVIKNENSTDGWVLLDNWTLTYYGANSSKQPGDDPSGINDINDVPTMKIEFFTLDGRKVSGQQKGIMIQKRTLGNGDVIVKKIRK
jgi:hypothetical protein